MNPFLYRPSRLVPWKLATFDVIMSPNNFSMQLKRYCKAFESDPCSDAGYFCSHKTFTVKSVRDYSSLFLLPYKRVEHFDRSKFVMRNHPLFTSIFLGFGCRNLHEMLSIWNTDDPKFHCYLLWVTGLELSNRMGRTRSPEDFTKFVHVFRGKINFIESGLKVVSDRFTLKTLRVKWLPDKIFDQRKSI